MVAAFALAAGFFLPIVEGCNSPIYPCQIAYAAFFEADPGLWDERLFFGVAALAPYLLGVLVGAGLVRHRSPATAWRALRDPIAWLIILAGGALLAIMAAEYLRMPPAAGLDASTAITFVLVALSLLFVLRSGANATGGRLCLRWYGALCCIAWFIRLAWDGGACWGLWWSLGAGVALVLAGTSEAAVAVDDKPHRVIRALILCSIYPMEGDGQRCRKCGYNLFGLSAPRCPECGTAFDRPRTTVPSDESAQNPIAKSTSHE